MDVEALMDRFRGPLVGFIASLGVPWGEAIELAQDTFAEAYLARDRFRGSFDDAAKVGPWLRGIAVNRWRQARRTARRRAAVPLADREPVVPVGSAPDARQVRILEAIERLDGPLKAVVRMHYLEETRVADVAALLGVTPKTVEGRLYRARRELRRILEEGSEGELRAAAEPVVREDRDSIRRER